MVNGTPVRSQHLRDGIRPLRFPVILTREVGGEGGSVPDKLCGVDVLRSGL